MSLQIFELLDRFELLYPTKSQLSDLRRLYIDKDLSSLFRLKENEELRKAIIEQNLHSIFRLLGEGENSELRKLILEDNIYKLWPILEKEINTNFVNTFKTLHRLNLPYDKDCFSRGQLTSKLWLIKELSKITKDLGVIYICAGWYATLATMLFENDFTITSVRSFDIDPDCIQIAEIFNKKWYMDQWKFKALTANILDINYNSHTWEFWSTKNNRISKPITDIPNTIINTSCEHIDNFSMWYDKIPTDKLVILQTNNYYDIEDHVNCSNSLKNFADISPMSKVYFEGELDLDKYTRFMRIGIK